MRSSWSIGSGRIHIQVTIVPFSAQGLANHLRCWEGFLPIQADRIANMH